MKKRRFHNTFLMGALISTGCEESSTDLVRLKMGAFCGVPGVASRSRGNTPKLGFNGLRAAGPPNTLLPTGPLIVDREYLEGADGGGFRMRLSVGVTIACESSGVCK